MDSKHSSSVQINLTNHFGSPIHIHSLCLRSLRMTYLMSPYQLQDSQRTPSYLDMLPVQFPNPQTTDQTNITANFLVFLTQTGKNKQKDKQPLCKMAFPLPIYKYKDGRWGQGFIPFPYNNQEFKHATKNDTQRGLKRWKNSG